MMIAPVPQRRTQAQVSAEENCGEHLPSHPAGAPWYRTPPPASKTGRMEHVTPSHGEDPWGQGPVIFRLR